MALVALGAASLLLPSVPAAEAKKRSKYHEFGARVLKQGAKGRDVRVLQDFLSRAGVGTPVDGRFGPDTRRKVRAWEERRASDAAAASAAGPARGLRVDGRLTRREARLLRQDVEQAEAGRAPAGAPAGASAPPSGPGDKATLAPDGTAVAPESAPEVVKQLIAAGNEIHDKPYRYGGGHKPPPNRDSGYDCSGSMSFAFQGAGLLEDALDSSGFAAWGEAGPGEWVTIYANSGHSYMIVAGLRFDTSGRSGAESRWQTKQRSSSGYTVRHPAGL